MRRLPFRTAGTSGRQSLRSGRPGKATSTDATPDVSAMPGFPFTPAIANRTGPRARAHSAAESIGDFGHLADVEQATGVEERLGEVGPVDGRLSIRQGHRLKLADLCLGAILPDLADGLIGVLRA